MSPRRYASILSVAVVLAVGTASAQTARSHDSSASPSITESSSNSASLVADNALDSDALPAAPGGAASGAGQEHGGYSSAHSIFSHLTYEAGAGFNAPIGNDTPYITWGGNFTVGGGYRFSDRLSALLEYQFIDDKLPGSFIAAEGTDSGNSHINSIVGSPVFTPFPKRSTGVYAVGGYGYYHKSTNFSDYECCSYYGYVAVTVGSITSNQWGANGGLGIYHRLGGIYGDGKAKLFAEARYTFLHTPSISQTNGLGTTELIPVTLGVRF
jgi:hypothetical protein